MTTHIRRLTLPLVFPAGIAPGDGGDFNALLVARNGIGNPVLRGTALAGAIRHAWRKHLASQGLSVYDANARVKQLFGYALDGDEAESGQESRLQVADCVLQVGQAKVGQRTHHLRNRHTGVVADGGLFSLESCPPGSSTTATLWLRDENETSGEAQAFLQVLVTWLESGMMLGGKSARGVGLTKLASSPQYKSYDLTDLDDHARYLDDHRAWRQNHEQRSAGANFAADAEQSANGLRIAVSLVIPRGQDLLVGDGQGMDYEIEPQRVTAADGGEYWRLPGSSLRGLLRGWIARLAAREGKPVTDSAERQAARASGSDIVETDRYTGENLGWCFLPKDERRQGVAQTDCPVSSLFGSVFQRGRIHISDSFSLCSVKKGERYSEEQMRMHVAVDRITGGAAESMLFSNTVLTAHADGKSPQFELVIRVEEPTEDEVRWLAKTLRALNVGVLRVGSSKSSGRLALAKSPTASGMFAESFLSAWNSRREANR